QMHTPEDANYLSSFVKSQTQLGLWALAARGLDILGKKLSVDVKAETLYLRLSLTEKELREVLSSIDTTSGSTQDPASN
ncbi:MAG: hypothetical protein AAGC55_01245, partial [Myxococcota bacterium]